MFALVDFDLLNQKDFGSNLNDFDSVFFLIRSQAFQNPLLQSCFCLTQSSK